MEQSILSSTKKILGVAPDDDSFDLDIMTHINSAFSTLNDLGVGAEAGFAIDDDTQQWGDFIDEEYDLVQKSRIKTFVFLYTRRLFDPPTTSFLLDALNKQIEEHTWRLNVKREESFWYDPSGMPNDVIDGGVVGEPGAPVVVDGGDAEG